MTNRAWVHLTVGPAPAGIAVEWVKRPSNTARIDASVELPTRNAAARTARLMHDWLAEQTTTMGIEDAAAQLADFATLARADPTAGADPRRARQQRYETSERGRQNNRERQRRHAEKRKASLTDLAKLQAEIADLRKRHKGLFGVDGLTLGSPAFDLFVFMCGGPEDAWRGLSKQKALKIADLIVRKATKNTKTLAALLKGD